MDPLTLKLLASLSFGLAAALFVVVGYRLTDSAANLDARKYTPTSMRRAAQRERSLRSSLFWPMLLPIVRALADPVARMGPVALREYVRRPYATAGYPGGMEDDEVVALGLIIGSFITVFLAFSAVVLVGPAVAFAALLGFPLGFLALMSTLKTRAANRQADMLRSLPYVLDLIILILRSGTTLGIALARVVDDYKDQPLGDELGQVLAELNMGASKIDAFKSFAKRVNVGDVVSLADSIVQSEELGWPLADTLERLADRLAAERVLRAQATAGAAGGWVMLPSTLVLMAAILLLFGTLIVRILRGEFKLQ